VPLLLVGQFLLDLTIALALYITELITTVKKFYVIGSRDMHY